MLNGTKMWITNGNLADVATVWAQTDDGIRGFVVPTDTPGFTANEIHRKLSLRASVTSELVLDNVRLPASAQLPLAQGLSALLSCLNEARFGIVFGALGAARDSLETAIDYAGSREVFDKPLTSYQLTQEKLANMTVELGKGMLLAHPPGPDQGCRRRSARADQPGQAQQRPRSPGHRARMPDPAGRQRNHPRILTTAPRQQPRIRAHLRRHLRDASTVHRQGTDRPGSLPLSRRNLIEQSDDYAYTGTASAPHCRAMDFRRG